MKNHSPIMTKVLFSKTALFLFLYLIPFTVLRVSAEDEKKANIAINFVKQDSLNVCQATVTSAGTPVKETAVHFYAKRMFSLLPLGKAVSTDENGMAKVKIPVDLPGDNAGSIVVIAKIEDDDNFGTVESQATLHGAPVPENKDEWANRSLSASREKAPAYLIITSNIIIAGIWGTLVYIIFQVYLIRKNSRLIKKK
jgi:hypothetical protein